MGICAKGADLDFRLSLPLLMPPRAGLCKLGKSAMDGAFSLVATWMSCRGDPAGAGQFTACPEGGISGVSFLWILSLDKQRKYLVRNKHALCSVQLLKRTKQCHRP